MTQHSGISHSFLPPQSLGTVALVVRHPMLSRTALLWRCSFVCHCKYSDFFRFFLLPPARCRVHPSCSLINVFEIRQCLFSKCSVGCIFSSTSHQPPGHKNINSFRVRATKCTTHHVATSPGASFPASGQLNLGDMQAAAAANNALIGWYPAAATTHTPWSWAGFTGQPKSGALETATQLLF